MTSDDTRTHDAPLVPGAHRTIRMLDVGEGPYPGALVAQGDSIAVLTSADDLSGWAGWAHAGDEHVAGPIDLVRRSDGHDVLLPWCTERVSAFAGRRSAALVPLTAGEVSTLVGSLLRGIAELGSAAGVERVGEWWLTDGGRPLFVIGAGTDARAGAARLVDRLRRDCADRALVRVLGTVVAGLDDAERPRLPARLLEGWEAELLAIAAPRPLRTDLHGPDRVRDIELVSRMPPLPIETGTALRGGSAASRSASRSVAHPGTPRGASVVGKRAEALRCVLHARWSRLVGDRVGADVGRRRRAPGTPGAPGAPGGSGGDGGESIEIPSERQKSTRRKRRVVVAGAVAALVLAAGLLWPEGEAVEGATVEKAGGSPAQASPGPEQVGAQDSRRTPTPVTAGSTPPSSSVAAQDSDPAVAAPALWQRIATCERNADDPCAAVVEGSASAVLDAVSHASGAEPTFSLVDEYGDVAVVKATVTSAVSASGGSTTELMLVLVRVEDEWLVRDVYDVADQP